METRKGHLYLYIIICIYIKIMGISNLQNGSNGNH